MLKISIKDGPNQRRLVVEGKLVTPWVDELKVAREQARADLNGRELVIDLENLTTISQQGETLLMELLRSGAKFRGHGVYTKYVLRQIANAGGVPARTEEVSE